MGSRDYQTCRFCGESSFHASDDGVKYGVRHWAHFKCFLDAGKALSELHGWQIGHFPFLLLKDRGLLEHAQFLIKKSERPNLRVVA